MDASVDAQVAEAHEQTYLAYIKRWTAAGRRTSPLTRDQVVQLVADYPFRDESGKTAINELLEVHE